ncbi:putative sugar O-methyltransferase [Candidatus Peregrinibacteria bacterium]|nr:putative sugar O-methyltransferase [Candidatus Peregrinibacteria bacterium]
MNETHRNTWEHQTSLSGASLQHINAKNFYMTSAFAGLYDHPSPFPFLEKRIVGTLPLRDIFPMLMAKRRYRKRLSWMMEFDRFDSLIPYLPDYEKTKKFCPLYGEWKGKKMNGNFLKAADELEVIERYVPRLNYVVEIGGGFGAMAEVVIKKRHPVVYCIIDLPETLKVAEIYLKSVFPERHETSIILIEAGNYDKAKELVQHPDLFINSNSFAEMNIETVKNYFKFIESFDDVYLSNTNRDRMEQGHHYAGVETYPYGDRWEHLCNSKKVFSYWRKHSQMISHLP